MCHFACKNDQFQWCLLMMQHKCEVWSVLLATCHWWCHLFCVDWCWSVSQILAICFFWHFLQITNALPQHSDNDDFSQIITGVDSIHLCTITIVKTSNVNVVCLTSTWLKCKFFFSPLTSLLNTILKSFPFIQWHVANNALHTLHLCYIISKHHWNWSFLHKKWPKPSQISFPATSCAHWHILDMLSPKR